MDIPLLITSPNSRTERRITPSWTLTHLKSRLEPITGIPRSSQKLILQTSPPIPLVSPTEDTTPLSIFPLTPGLELQVQDIRPPGLRPNYTDVSAVEKYSMPPAEYESRSDTVLAWKKKNKLGRFDENAQHDAEEVRRRHDAAAERVKVGRRCRLRPETDQRRGEVAFVGDIGELGGGAWVGVRLDEPSGKNDGTVEGKRYFHARAKCGVFVRPERVEVGDFGVEDVDEDDEF
ncbi:hypothetical protein K470DRAFT_257091 [Piedraia hortae CBS 480.64]|uniref:CAP-Gly domain-containing protein n=1 Tax=Piedraia hortae CBS 480.64 TaxID=1314780 RepID=A0A6A7C1L2_9PEZI|nr:hypothetical protein K470DRAFT_257091 [Piedraia hortae CBS 480.64]